jgi:hypothetical protein
MPLFIFKMMNDPLEFSMFSSALKKFNAKQDNVFSIFLIVFKPDKVF